MVKEKLLSRMFVLKRDGRQEPVHFDKITSRIQKLCYGLDMDYIDPPAITLKVISGLYPGVTTVELDNLAAEIAATMTTKHPDYAILAARIVVANLHKETKKVFSEVMKDLYEMTSHGKPTPMISEFHYKIIQKHADRLNSAIVYDRDFSYQYFGFKTLERSYLLKIDGKVVERPQHMLMRVAVGIHGEDIDDAIETYNMMSEKLFTHASPTMFNAATPRPQLSSCFLLTMSDDSIEGIYDTLKQTALISKSAGGIGLNVHCIRAKGTYIAGTNGMSNGLVPMLRVYNNTARYVDQVELNHTYELHFNVTCISKFKTFDLTGWQQTSRRVRHLHRAVAQRHLRLPRPAQEPRKGGAARPRPLLRPLDPGSLHEARRGGRHVESHVPPRVSRPRRLLGRGVREALHRV